ncbi:response regulator [Variovorax sp. RHLX14]|uniref:response regulator n=1 Tax=Variovorax sp. RHLX14 TaxID=1259731 RepID=UPI003F470B06
MTSDSRPIRVMLVDDHALVRMGFRMLLTNALIEVAAEADTGEQACQSYPQVRPDVVVMDLAMPGMGGLEAIRRILAHDIGARILALSAHEDTVHPHRVLQAGALGYLTKRSAPEALIAALRAVARGERYIDAATAQALAVARFDGAAPPAETLSTREFSVFLQLAQGMSVAQIAATLNLSLSTVGSHLYRIKQKLNANNQAELTLVALRWGLIQV